MNEWNKINKGDTIVMNNEVGYTATIQDIQQNNGIIILNCKTGTGTGTGTGTADTSCDSPIDSTLTNISSIYVVGKFCCEKDDKGNDQEYDNTNKKCIACQYGNCNGKCLEAGKSCMPDRTVCNTSDIVGGVCCRDANRKCGDVCCSDTLSRSTVTCNTAENKCAISCGTDKDGKPQWCDKDKQSCLTITGDKNPDGTDKPDYSICVTDKCKWSTPIQYFPYSIKNLPICALKNSDGTIDNTSKTYFCQPTNNAGAAWVRTSKNFACPYSG